MEIDKDNNGYIDKEEFALLLQKSKSNILPKDQKFDELFKQCDLDGDGKIDYHEFLVASFNHKAVLTEENLQKAFNLFDVNKDGSIEIDELKVVLPTRNI